MCVLAAWFYTGGSRPYGYLGLGEVMVFVFFGLVAVVGTTYVQTETFDSESFLPALYAAVGVGALACAILVVNNLRDIPTDTVAGKRTLAVVLGADRTRGLYLLLVLAAAVACVAVAVSTTWWALLGLGFLLPAARGRAHGAVRRGRPGAGAGAAVRPAWPSWSGRCWWRSLSSPPAHRLRLPCRFARWSPTQTSRGVDHQQRRRLAAC